MQRFRAKVTAVMFVCKIPPSFEGLTDNFETNELDAKENNDKKGL